MKLVHLSDLHIGKRVNEFSMLEDQQYILTKIINIIDEEKPQAVIIAGDIYDKPIPSAEAVELFDDFLVRLASRGIQIFAISGNHDSAERIAFGARLMDGSGVHMAPAYRGITKPITLTDDFGEVNIFMLPFIKPVNVRRYFPEVEISSYTDAVKAAIDSMEINAGSRNVLVTHQFVTGALRCDSEDISVGGADNVDVEIFAPFDYVALGHIHNPQKAGRENVRYCGTPLKYSFSEANHEKSVSIVELMEKGSIEIRTARLIPMRDLREAKGSYMEVTARDFYSGSNTQDYLHITLTDEEDILDAMGKLRAIYPNIMKLDYDNKRTRTNMIISGADNVERKLPAELFAEFYEKQNNQPFSEEQHTFVSAMIEKIWEDVK